MLSESAKVATTIVSVGSCWRLWRTTLRNHGKAFSCFHTQIWNGFAMPSACDTGAGLTTPVDYAMATAHCKASKEAGHGIIFLKKPNGSTVSCLTMRGYA